MGQRLIGREHLKPASEGVHSLAWAIFRKTTPFFMIPKITLLGIELHVKARKQNMEA